jgi:hypothetical protein
MQDEVGIDGDGHHGQRAGEYHGNEDKVAVMRFALSSNIIHTPPLEGDRRKPPSYLHIFKDKTATICVYVRFKWYPNFPVHHQTTFATKQTMPPRIYPSTSAEQQIGKGRKRKEKRERNVKR